MEFLQKVFRLRQFRHFLNWKNLIEKQLLNFPEKLMLHQEKMSKKALPNGQVHSLILFRQLGRMTDRQEIWGSLACRLRMTDQDTIGENRGNGTKEGIMKDLK